MILPVANAWVKKVNDRWSARAPEMVASQLRQSSGSYPLTYLVTLIVTGSMVLSLSDRPGFQSVLNAAIFHVAISTVTLFKWLADKRSDWRTERPVRQLGLHCVQAGLVSVGWFTFLPAAASAATLEQQVVIATVMAGVIAIGALRYATVIEASLLFLAVAVTLSGVYALFAAVPWEVFVFLGIFVVMLGRTVIAHSRMFEQQFHAGAALAQARADQSILAAKAEQEHWRMMHASAEEASLAQVRSQEERNFERQALAEVFQESIVRIATDLAQSAEHTMASAHQLARNGSETQERIAGVADEAQRADAGALELVETTAELVSILSQIKRDLEAQESAYSNVSDIGRAIDLQFNNLVDAARSTESIVQTISEIANRSNLLALNATIEAARAGDAGRGFTIVAAEVRSLAEQTAESTEVIRTKLEVMAQAIDGASNLVNSMQSSFGEMKGVSRAVSDAIERQSIVGSAVQVFATAAASLVHQIQDAARSAEEVAGEAAALSGELGIATSRMAADSRRLVDETRGFLARVA